jgi:hypothetical protein
MTKLTPRCTSDDQHRQYYQSETIRQACRFRQKCLKMPANTGLSLFSNFALDIQIHIDHFPNTTQCRMALVANHPRVCEVSVHPRNPKPPRCQ